MRILLTIGDISITGGAERVVVNLAHAFMQNGYDVELLSFFQANAMLPYEIDSRIPLHIWQTEAESVFNKRMCANIFSKTYYKNFHKIMLNIHIHGCFRDFDVVIANDNIYMPFLKHKQTSYIKIIHLNFSKYHRRNTFFHTLIILSSREQSIWEQYHRHIKVIPNFLPTIPTQSALSTQHRIISVGRMDRGDQKGFLRLLDIWAIVQDSIKLHYPHLQSWQLIIVGSGDLKEVIELKIKQLHLADSIILKPFAKDIESEYLSASIYAMASYFEGFGMVLAEASSYTLPCIAFDVKTGPSDIIDDGKSGYLIKDNDLQDYANKLIALMDSESLRKDMGKNAKAKMQEQFSKEAIMPLWEQILKGCPQQKPLIAESSIEKPHQVSHIHFYIIIPLYNVENYIKRCLESLYTQSYERFTAIIINDGSIDKSAEIAAACVAEDKRFILHHQSNQGLSMARNKGLDLVKELENAQDRAYQSHIVFLDSDDYLESNALGRMAHILEAHNADVLVESAIKTRDPLSDEILPSTYSVFPPHVEGLYTPHTLIQSIGNKCLATNACTFILNAKFLFASNIRFVPYILYEDIAFCTQIILAAQSIYVDNAHVYNYVLSPDSIMRATPSPNARMRQANSYFTLLQMFVAYKEQSDDEIFKSHYHNTCIIIVKKLMRSLQFIGYKVGFSKADLKPYLPYIRGKYRFCYHFPRIYGIPKRIRLVL